MDLKNFYFKCNFIECFVYKLMYMYYIYFYYLYWKEGTGMNSVFVASKNLVSPSYKHHLEWWLGWQICWVGSPVPKTHHFCWEKTYLLMQREGEGLRYMELVRLWERLGEKKKRREQRVDLHFYLLSHSHVFISLKSSSLKWL